LRLCKKTTKKEKKAQLNELVSKLEIEMKHQKENLEANKYNHNAAASISRFKMNQLASNETVIISAPPRGEINL
jgi:hypothetical protein